MEKKNFMLMRELPDELIEDMKSKGMFRCGVLMPDCRGRPYAAIWRKSVKVYSTFCLRHAIVFAEKEGLSLPIPEDN